MVGIIVRRRFQLLSVRAQPRTKRSIASRAILPILLLLLSGVSPASYGQDVLATLFDDYKAYGLPLPPKDATLAILPSPSVSVTNGVRQQDMHLVLLVKPATAKDSAVYWVGCEKGPEWHGIELRPVPPQRASLDNTVPLPPDFRTRGFPTYPDLALAIQCRALGWNELAGTLRERSRDKPRPRHFERVRPRPADDRKALAELAWNYYCNQFTRLKTDRKTVVDQMKKLFATPFGLDTKARRDIIEDMEKTLIAVKTAPNSIEADIEGLLDFEDLHGTWLGTGWQDLRNYSDWNPHYKNLRDRGILAAPLLMEHLHDYRLTRTLATTKDNSYTWHIRIADVVAQLLNGLASEPFAFDFLESAGRGVSLDRAHVQAWWKEAGAQKELDYLVRNLDRKGDRSDREPNEAVLHALGNRYPTELVRLFEQRLGQGQGSHAWFTALGKSKAPQETKARLFLAAAKRKDDWSQILALRELADLHHPETVPLVIQALEAQPTTSKETEWHSNIGNFAQIAMCAHDQRAWDALLKTARRVDVNKRMEIIDTCGRIGSLKKDLSAVRFLKSFFSDKEARDPKKGGFPILFDEGMTVGDLAAQQLAYMLGLKVDVGLTWKATDRQKFRQQVEAAADKLERESKAKRP
jgi:hypothetical protein